MSFLSIGQNKGERRAGIRQFSGFQRDIQGRTWRPSIQPELAGMQGGRMTVSHQRD
jgi:hypothetical protein